MSYASSRCCLSLSLEPFATNTKRTAGLHALYLVFTVVADPLTMNASRRRVAGCVCYTRRGLVSSKHAVCNADTSSMIIPRWLLHLTDHFAVWPSLCSLHVECRCQTCLLAPSSAPRSASATSLPPHAPTDALTQTMNTTPAHRANGRHRNKIMHSAASEEHLDLGQGKSYGMGGKTTNRDSTRSGLMIRRHLRGYCHAWQYKSEMTMGGYQNPHESSVVCGTHAGNL